MCLSIYQFSYLVVCLSIGKQTIHLPRQPGYLSAYLSDVDLSTYLSLSPLSLSLSLSPTRCPSMRASVSILHVCLSSCLSMFLSLSAFIYLLPLSHLSILSCCLSSLFFLSICACHEIYTSPCESAAPATKCLPDLCETAAPARTSAPDLAKATCPTKKQALDLAKALRLPRYPHVPVCTAMPMGFATRPPKTPRLNKSAPESAKAAPARKSTPQAARESRLPHNLHCSLLNGRSPEPGPLHTRSQTTLRRAPQPRKLSARRRCQKTRRVSLCFATSPAARPCMFARTHALSPHLISAQDNLVISVRNTEVPAKLPLPKPWLVCCIA